METDHIVGILRKGLPVFAFEDLQAEMGVSAKALAAKVGLARAEPGIGSERRTKQCEAPHTATREQAKETRHLAQPRLRY